MAIVLVLIALLVLAVLVTGNWYVWRRLFRDTTRGPGAVRRAGAVLIAGGWALAVGAMVAGRAGAPFWLQQVLAWPGFLWLALSMYLVLGLLAGELVRPVLRRVLERRDRTAAAAPDAPADAPAEVPAKPESIPAGHGARPAKADGTGAG
ncbi:metallophosphoesterase, partial [Streptomyces sp. NPDC056290]